MIDQRLCSACGKQNRRQARFCGYCGKLLQDAMSEKNSMPHEVLERTEVFPRPGTPLLDRTGEDVRMKTMKPFILTIVLVAVLGLLVSTNPALDEYEGFIRQQMIQDSKTDAERGIVYLFGGFASRFIAGQTHRSNYVVLSVYDTKLGDEHLRVLGILNNFIILERPRSLEAGR